LERFRITSRANETLKRAAALKEKKARDAEGRFAAEGGTLLAEALSAGVFPEEIFAADRASARADRILAPFEALSFRRFDLPDDVFEKVTVEAASDGILSVFSSDALPRLELPEGGADLIVLENVQDPGNAGTALRCAAAFGFAGVCAVGCADHRSQKATRASMGALFRVPVRVFSSTGECFDFLEKAGVSSVALALKEGAVPLTSLPFPARAAFWIGNEGSGLSGEAVRRASGVSVIPMQNAESLNAGVCAGVVAWEVFRRKAERRG
jgi:TrmH family RNA methyltransferase